jgi:hypothetical protein
MSARMFWIEVVAISTLWSVFLAALSLLILFSIISLCISVIGLFSGTSPVFYCLIRFFSYILTFILSLYLLISDIYISSQIHFFPRTWSESVFDGVVAIILVLCVARWLLSRVKLQWRHSTVAGAHENEILARRARRF